MTQIKKINLYCCKNDRKTVEQIKTIFDGDSLSLSLKFLIKISNFFIALLNFPAFFLTELVSQLVLLPFCPCFTHIPSLLNNIARVRGAAG